MDAVAEKRANTEAWQLVLTFRAASEEGRRQTFWTPYPLESTTKAGLFILAQRLTDAALSQVLAERLT